MLESEKVLYIQCMVRVLDVGLDYTSPGLIFPVPNNLDASVFMGGDYTFVYDYPLRERAEFTHTLTPSTTSEDLLKIGLSDYRNIYAEEERTTPIAAQESSTINIGGRTLILMNRTSTTGRYGIWGHVLADLFFEGIAINTELRLVKFTMGS